jgi:hypothetical protein
VLGCGGWNGRDGEQEDEREGRRGRQSVQDLCSNIVVVVILSKAVKDERDERSFRRVARNFGKGLGILVSIQNVIDRVARWCLLLRLCSLPLDDNGYGLRSSLSLLFGLYEHASPDASELRCCFPISVIPGHRPPHSRQISHRQSSACCRRSRSPEGGRFLGANACCSFGMRKAAELEPRTCENGASRTPQEED